MGEAVEFKDKIAGAILGAAIGDAMGHPTEFLSSFEAIRAKYGPDGVTGYELYWEREGIRFAPYTDDTQMAEVVCRCLMESLGERECTAVLDAFAVGSHKHVFVLFAPTWSIPNWLILIPILWVTRWSYSALHVSDFQ